MKTFVKTVLLTMIAFLSFVPTASAQNNTSSAEVLTHEKVITMVKAGLSAGIIVNKIRSSKTDFNTSTDELIHL